MLGVYGPGDYCGQEVYGIAQCVGDSGGDGGQLLEV